MRNQPIVRQVNYTAHCAPECVELAIEAEMISFVEERIPDGQMAGMMGHREVPGTSSVTYNLHPAQAQHLWEQLGDAIRNWESQWGRRGRR
jgi:hypothetical protein